MKWFLFIFTLSILLLTSTAEAGRARKGSVGKTWQGGAHSGYSHRTTPPGPKWQGRPRDYQYGSKGHYRTYPNSVRQDNYSYPGNLNIRKGKFAE